MKTGQQSSAIRSDGLTSSPDQLQLHFACLGAGGGQNHSASSLVPALSFDSFWIFVIGFHLITFLRSIDEVYNTPTRADSIAIGIGRIMLSILLSFISFEI